MKKLKFLFIAPIENECNPSNLCQFPNVGDIALTMGTRKMIQGIRPFSDIIIESVGFDFDNNIEYINSFDYLVFAGGGIFHPCPTKSNILLNMSIETIDKIKSKIIINSCGMNFDYSVSNLSDHAFSFIEKLINKSVFASARDTETINRIKNYCKINKKIYLTFDPAFYLEWNFEYSKTKCDFGIVYNERYHEAFEDIISDYEEYNFGILHHVPCEKNPFLGYENVYNFSFKENPFYLFANYANCDVIIGAQYHSIIFSILTEKPFININYNIKNKAFATDNDFGNQLISEENLRKHLKDKIEFMDYIHTHEKSIIMKYSNNLELLNNLIEGK